MVRHFLGCIAFSARSSRSANIAPDAPGRVMFTRCLGARLRRLKLGSVSLSRGKCLFTALPSGIGRRIPMINFVTRVSADPSVDKRGIGPHVIRGCSKGSVPLYTRRGVVLSPTGFPRLLSRMNRSLVIASKCALLKTSSGTKVTRVMNTITCLVTRPRVGRNSVHVNFGPSRRVNLKTRGFSMRGFNTG